MTGIFGPRMDDKPAHHAEAPLSLVRGRRLGGPGNGRLSLHVGLPVVSGEPGKAAQQPGIDRQREPRRPADGEIAVDGAAQHGAPPAVGQGCATARRWATSTLA